MTRVLYFSSATHIQGGAVQNMFRMACWLKEQEGRPIVVLPREVGIVDWYAKEGIEVFVSPFVEMHRRWSPLYLIRYLFSTIVIIIKLMALIKQHHIDIVHVNEITYWPGLVAGKIAGAKTLCHVRVIIEKPIWAWRMLTWITQRFSDRTLCVSDAVRTRMFPFRSGNVQTLYDPGPDLDRFDPLSVQIKSDIRNELKIGQDVFLVGQVSKFTPNKNQLALVNVAKYIKERYPNLQIEYLIVGGKVAGYEEYSNRVTRLISESGVSDQFVLTGCRSDVPRIIAACDVMVHPPIHEDPLPGVVFEAMAMERPIIAFDSGGISEQFENGKSGILVPKNDIESLAEVLVVLANDEAKRTNLGKEARRYLVSHFSFDRYFSELSAIHCELLDRP